MIARHTDIPESSLVKWRADLGRKSSSKQSCSLSDGEPRVRVRQKHHKVRTGCLTCKIRRKKCDETKPFCKACERTGRKCDGYAVTSTAGATVAKDSGSEKQTDEKSDASTLSAVHSPSSVEQLATESSPRKGANIDHMLDNISLGSMSDVFPTRYNGRGSILLRKPRGIAMSPDEITPLEALCYRYFLERTLGHVSAYFECSIWRTLAIRTNLMHPVLFKVATALGAVHRRFASGISREAFEYCLHSAILFDKASTALCKLKHNVAMADKTKYMADREVIIVGEMLLSLFQVFQGNYDASAAHADTAIESLLPPTSQLQLLHSERRYSASEGRPRTFCRFLNALYCRSIHIFGTRIQPVASCGCFQPSTLPVFPDTFLSVDQARDYIFMLVDWVMHSAERICQDVESRREAHELGVRRLLAWTRAYTAYAKSHGNPITTQEKQARMLLKLVRNATYLLLYNTHFTGIEQSLPRLPPLAESLDHDPDQDTGLAAATSTLWGLIKQHQALEHDIGIVKDEIEAMISEGLIFDFDKHGTPPAGPVICSELASLSSSTSEVSGQDESPAPSTEVVSSRGSTIWESVGTFSIAEKISDIEETALVSAIMHLVPGYVDQRCVDTTCDIERRVIVVRYYHPDVFGVGLCRVQDWWSF